MKGLERKLEQYSSLTVEQESKTMSRLTLIDLTKMDEQSRIYYIQDLMIDTIKAVQDLTNNEVQYGYIKHILDHTRQAVLDLEKLIQSEKTN